MPEAHLPPRPEDLPAGMDGCPVEEALRLLSGKWRLLAIFRLGQGPMRFNALQRALAPVTQKVLTATLRRLEADRLVWRRVEATVPPNVTYGLTERGAALAPIFDALAVWHLGAAAVKRGRPAGWEA
jgi:DNA-binding HxlR family transcriptional regulator